MNAHLTWNMELQGTSAAASPWVYSRSEHLDNSLNIINYVTQGLCMGLVTICVPVRFYAKQNVWKSFNIEDFLCLIAWFSVIGYCIASIIYSSFGGGYHMWQLDASQQRSILHVLYSIILLYVVALFFIKLLLLRILIRLFSPRKKLALFVRGLTVFVIAYYIAILLVRIFVCTPISGFWDGKCVNLDAVFIADSFVSLITDGAILVLPILLTWSLHMSLKKKIKIASILGFGGLTTVTNVYRLYLAFAERDTADVSVYIVRLLYTGAAETAIGLTCSCLPAINALVDHKFRQRSSASSKGPSPGISPS